MTAKTEYVRVKTTDSEFWNNLEVELLAKEKYRSMSNLLCTGNHI